MTPTVLSILVGALGGASSAKVLEWLFGRRKNKLDALKTALETISLATDEIRGLRNDLETAHKEIGYLRQEVNSLRNELANSQRKESS